MKTLMRYFTSLAVFGLLAFGTTARADDFSDTIAVFKNSNESASFFNKSYGYAVFPTVGEGGFVVAGSHGTGRVYARGAHVGDTAVTEVSVGAQAGAQAYSEILFFQNKAAFDRFTKGNFEFSADATAVAITAAAGATLATQGGGSANVSGNRKNAGTLGGYRRGVAVFTVVKGGAMLQAAIGGQKFSYTPKPR